MESEKSYSSAKPTQSTLRTNGSVPNEYVSDAIEPKGCIMVNTLPSRENNSDQHVGDSGIKIADIAGVDKWAYRKIEEITTRQPEKGVQIKHLKDGPDL